MTKKHSYQAKVMCGVVTVVLASLTTIQATTIHLNSSSAVASSADLPAASAFDGNSKTRWASSSSNDQWILVDLGSDFTLNAVTLDWETASARDYILRVRTSEQGLDSPVTPTNWTAIAAVNGRGGISDSAGGVVEDLFSFSNGTFTALVGTYSNATVSAAPKGRYLMIYGATRTTGWGCSIWEATVDGQGVGGAIGVQFQSAPGSVDLTAMGVTDWHYWLGGSGGPRILTALDQKVGGAAIRDGLSVSYTQSAKSGPIAYSWADGTPDAAVATNDMVKLREGGPSQAGFTVDLVKGYQGELRLWFGCWALITNRTVTVTAAYPDGTSASNSLNVAVNTTQYRECVIPFKPDAATTLAVTIAASGESELYLGAVTLASSAIPVKGSLLIVQ